MALLSIIVPVAHMMGLQAHAFDVPIPLDLGEKGPLILEIHKPCFVGSLCSYGGFHKQGALKQTPIYYDPYPKDS